MEEPAAWELRTTSNFQLESIKSVSSVIWFEAVQEHAH